MIPEPARTFTNLVHDLLADDLLSVILVGSFARDDERADSDIDLFVLLPDASNPATRSIGMIVRSISSPNEINPAVVSDAEFRQYPDWNELIKIRHDGIALHGHLPRDVAPVETELVLAKRIAHEVLMSARHYLAVDESPESFTSKKLWIYNLKPLSFSARYYHYAKTGHYIRRFDDLKGEYPVFSLDPVKHHGAVIEGCVELAQEILHA